MVGGALVLTAIFPVTSGRGRVDGKVYDRVKKAGSAIAAGLSQHPGRLTSGLARLVLTPMGTPIVVWSVERSVRNQLEGD